MSKDNEKYPYLRIGTQFFKITNTPISVNETLKTLTLWSRSTLKDDHLDFQSMLKKIPKYDGTVIIPNHLNYKREIKGFYNTYEPLIHEPSEGGFKQIETFIKHVFQEKFEMAYDYIKVMYEHPIRKLPVLCLVSEERKTGKTTFLNLLKEVFGYNMTIGKTDELRSRFNSDLLGKLIIGVEEVLFETIKDTELIKYLSTSVSFKAEAKGVDRIEANFFGKFILLSNYETRFIRIEPNEDRFWVIKVNEIKNENVNLLGQMKLEIPHFLNFLLERDYSRPCTTRLWFEFKDYETQALKRLKEQNRDSLELNALALIEDILMSSTIEAFQFTQSDLCNLLGSTKLNSLSNIRNLLKNKWKLDQVTNSNNYLKIVNLNGVYEGVKSKGRYYQVTIEWLNENI